MSFEKVETQAVDFPALEREVLRFWADRGVFDQLRRRNAGRPKGSFPDGPITANTPTGVHHAWGRSYKGAYNRYFAMTGHELRSQNGFGPGEVAVVGVLVRPPPGVVDAHRVVRG